MLRAFNDWREERARARRWAATESWRFVKSQIGTEEGVPLEEQAARLRSVLPEGQAAMAAPEAAPLRRAG